MQVILICYDMTKVEVHVMTSS